MKVKIHALLLLAVPMLSATAAASDSLSSSAEPGTYYQLERDYRECVSPLCGGFWVTELNNSKMKCADGSEATTCYVADIDWDEAGIGDKQAEELEALIDDGDEVVIAGKLTTAIYWGFGRLGVLSAAAAWTSVQDHDTALDDFRVEDLGFVCVREPCFNIGAELVNTGKSTTLSGLDLDGVDATEKELERARAAFEDGTLLIPGKISYSSERGGPRVLNAASFYLPVEPD